MTPSYQTTNSTFGNNEVVIPFGETFRAVEAWRNLLGSDRVTVSQESLNQHGMNAYGASVRAIAVVRPADIKQVQSIVSIAHQFKAPLYPISTGRNWGYGAASPVTEGCTVVDLSDLCEIRIIDRDLGIVSLEPGVTQGMLAEFFKREQLDWMVPVHGGGPDCSLLGNALERGYGLTPTTDHFAALTSLEAVLADGSTYRSPFHAMGAGLIGSAHRWGIGPYVEGLFSQGNFGIVTSATFAMQRRPEHTEAFFLRLRSDQELGELVDRLREILASMQSNIAGVNLMNDRRVLSMSRPYPVEQVTSGDIISAELCQKMTQSAGIDRWTAAGVIHCPHAMRHSIRRVLRKQIPGSISRPLHFNRTRLRWARRVAHVMPVGGGSVLQQLDSIESLLDLAEGIPSRVALPLAYWLRGKKQLDLEQPNPAKDGCGLIWYSPLVPMKQETVKRFTEMVESVCCAHKIEPLITLTTLSDRLFDSTVPILYRPEELGAKERAQQCYKALYEAGRALGCLPYRVGVDSMARVAFDAHESHFDFVSRLRRAVDPDGIISPGRYS